MEFYILLQFISSIEINNIILIIIIKLELTWRVDLEFELVRVKKNKWMNDWLDLAQSKTPGQLRIKHE